MFTLKLCTFSAVFESHLINIVGLIRFRKPFLMEMSAESFLYLLREWLLCMWACRCLKKTVDSQGRKREWYMYTFDLKGRTFAKACEIIEGKFL